MTAPTTTPPAELAQRRQAVQQLLARAAAEQAVDAWGDIDPTDIARSWFNLLARPIAATTTAQLVAAQAVDDYVDEVLAAQEADLAPAGRVVARAFAGIASDGRPLQTLLYNPAIQALQAIRDGADVGDALGVGRVALDVMVRTQVADAGRAATGVAIAARGAGYVRVLTPPSCSRCAVLAGRFYRWSAGFQRHPRCDCIHAPSTQAASKGVKDGPRSYFDTLSTKDQDRVFTKAGAQAIRDGADIGQVVNARRGMSTAVGPSGRRLAPAASGRLTTTESTSRSGVARRGRLMPEQIYIDAKGDRGEAVRLLKQHGYLI